MTTRPTKRIPWRVRRRARLISDGFLHWELHRFKGVHKLRCLTDYPLCRPYIIRMRIARRMLFNEAKARRFTMAEYRREIARLYKTMGWVDDKGRPDVWAMFRYFYRLSVQQDEYTPPPKKKKKWSKGDVKTQREKYKAKQEAKKRMGITEEPGRARALAGDVNEWIRQLEARIKTEKNPARVKQYEEQIKRLRRVV